jgi:hypothetical protein
MILARISAKFSPRRYPISAGLCWTSQREDGPPRAIPGSEIFLCRRMARRYRSSRPWSAASRSRRRRCERTWPATFRSFFAYDHCTVFFHLTYAYVEKTADVIDYLKKMAEKKAPGAFKYQGRDDIAKKDSQPPGFIAEYEGEHGPVKVVFLLLDSGRKPSVTRQNCRRSPRVADGVSRHGLTTARPAKPDAPNKGNGPYSRRH